MCLQIGLYGINSDTCGMRHRKMIYAGADRRKCNCFAAQCGCLRKAIAIAGCQQTIFIGCTTMPDRSRCVDDITTGETVCFGCFCFACGAAAKRSAFRQQFRSRSTMNRPIYTAAAEQRCIRRVNNCIDLALVISPCVILSRSIRQTFFQGGLLDSLYVQPRENASLTEKYRYGIIKIRIKTQKEAA